MNRILFSFLLIVITLACKGLDPLFSQYFSTPIYLNPAFAGYEGCSRISTSYRHQWPGASGGIRTVNHSYDQYVRQLMGGFAVNYQYDNISDGLLEAHSLSGIYSPSFRLLNKTLLISPGLEMGWRRRIMNWDKLTFGELIDLRYGFDYEGVESVSARNYRDMFDLSAGVLISHQNFVYGVAFHHLTRPNQGLPGDSKLPIKSTIHFSYVGEISEKFKISPSVIFLQQSQSHVFLPSLSFYIYGIKAGLGSSLTTDYFISTIFFFGYDRKWFSAGYSYDYAPLRRFNAKLVSHELSLMFKFNCKNDQDRMKGVKQINF